MRDWRSKRHVTHDRELFEGSAASQGIRPRCRYRIRGRVGYQQDLKDRTTPRWSQKSASVGAFYNERFANTFGAANRATKLEVRIRVACETDESAEQIKDYSVNHSSLCQIELVAVLRWVVLAH